MNQLDLASGLGGEPRRVATLRDVVRPPWLVWLALVTMAAPAGCLSTAPSDASAECLRDDDCGHCGRCDNGRCVFDEAAAARPFCVDETEDPCDGVDNDGNGVTDDPEECWAPVFAWLTDAGDRCFGASATVAPEPCAGYALESETAALALVGRILPDTVPVHQCSKGDEHILVAERVLFGSTATDAKTTLDAWRSLGYVCGPLLGHAFTRASDALARGPYGERCALNRFTSSEAGASRWTTWLGAGPVPSTWQCEQGGTLWVNATGDPCDAGVPDGCALDDCAPRASGRLVVASPPQDSALTPGGVHVGLRLENTGDVDWKAGWCFEHTAGVYANRPLPLEHDVAHGGGSYDALIELSVPPSGVDLTESWRLRDAPCSQGGGVVLSFDYRFDVESPLAASLVETSPVDAATLPVSGELVELSAVLRNSGTATWPDGLVVRPASSAGWLTDTVSLPPTQPGGTAAVVLGRTALTTPDSYDSRWRITDAAGETVPVDGAATFSITLYAVRPARHALLVGQTVAPGTILRAGTRFHQVVGLLNTGGQLWDVGTTLRHVAGSLAETDRIVRADQVPPGSTWVVAIPMRVPPGATAPLRDGWSLQDANGGVIGVERARPDGTTDYGTVDGAWLWTEITPGSPCSASPAVRP